MTRLHLRILFGICLLFSIVFAAWGWLRPYDWHPDPAASGKIIAAELIEDHSRYWLTVHVKLLPGQEHDLQKPVRLHVGNGITVEPADTTMAGEKGEGLTDLWFKFWLEEKELSGPIFLQIDDGKLLVKTKAGLPKLKAGGNKIYTTSSW